MKRWWVKALIGFGVLVALLWVSFLGAGVRSKNAVERYRDQLRAAGEKVDLKDVLPPRVSDESNSATALLDAAGYLAGSTDVLDTNPPPAMRMVFAGKAMIGWQQPEVWDEGCTNSWNEIGNAIDVRRPGLKLLQELPEGARFDFQLDYFKGVKLLLPHLAKIKACAQDLSAATVYSLHQGDLECATSNTLSLLKIANASDDERLLISELVRIAIVSIAVGPTWEILQSTNVTDSQLESLHSAWSHIQFLEPAENALMTERAYSSVSLQQLRSSPDPSAKLIGGSSGPAFTGDWLEDLKVLGESAKEKVWTELWRNSWSYDDELRMFQTTQVAIETIRRVRTDGSFNEPFRWRDREFAANGLDAPSENWLRSRFEDEFVELFGSAGIFGKFLDKVLVAEASKSMMVASIALKRWELRHVRLPERLDDLVPAYLPRVPADPVDGRPLRYKPYRGGAFLLYSIGKDGTDGAGNPLPAGTSKSLYWALGHDWVWPQPATEAEVEAYRISEAAKR